jgi:class 3 adenylate cyclase
MTRGLSVGAKIHGIGIGLILLMVTVSAVSAVLIDRVRAELQLQASVFIPLSNRIASIETAVLEGEVHIERMRLAMAEGRSGASYEEAHNEIRDVSGLVDDQFARARGLLESLSEDDLDKRPLVAATKISAGLDAVQTELADYREQLDRLLDAHQAGRLEEARLLDTLLAEEEEEIYHRLERMRIEMQDQVERAVAEIIELDIWFDRVIIVFTVGAVILGALVSSLVTRRIVNPIGELVHGLKRVGDGDLQTELSVRTRDETATMAEGFNEMIAGLRAKERITDTFGTYVDRRVVDALIGNPAMTKQGGDRRRMTVMFADMTGFTSLSESLPPDSLVALLNAYFERMAAPVGESDGVIDKFIGDSIMAYWGPPFVDARKQAGLAVGAALAQIGMMQAFRDSVPEILGIPMDASKFDIHTGIATGQTLVGTVGSSHHRNYTIMGDTVNVAARLEGACKAYGVRLLVDESTRSETEGVLFRELDSLRVKGRAEPVRIFEPMALGPGSPDQARLAAAFETGLTAYRHQDFAAAEQAFAACLDIAPEDKATVILLERTMALAANPPSPDWDGVWTMTSK